MLPTFGKHLGNLLVEHCKHARTGNVIDLSELNIKTIFEFIKALNMDIENSDSDVKGWYVFECTTSGTWMGMGEDVFDGSVYFKPDIGEPVLVLIIDNIIY